MVFGTALSYIIAQTLRVVEHAASVAQVRYKLSTGSDEGHMCRNDTSNDCHY